MALTQINPALFAGSSNTTAVIQSNGTTAITVDSSQRVGIGTSTPTQLLQLEAAGNPCILLKDTTNNVQAYMFAGDVASYIGSANNYPVVFQVNDVENMRLNTNGALILKGGSTSASGVGIAFPATQSASTDANTLDDYEEGTWTPTLRGSSSNPTVSSSNATGWYTKIGNLVTLSFSCNFTFTGGSGAVWIGNIPFIPSALSIGTLEAGGLTMGGSYTYGVTLLGSGDDHVEIRKYSNAGSGETAVIFSNYASASWLRSNISFKT